MLSMNTTPGGKHHNSPQEILFGRLPADRHFWAAPSDPMDTPVHPFVQELAKQIRQIHEQVTQARPPSPTKPKPLFQEGDNILVFNYPKYTLGKLNPRWRGPFPVVAIPSPFRVSFLEEDVIRTVHVNDVKRCQTPAPAGCLPRPCRNSPGEGRFPCRGNFRGRYECRGSLPRDGHDERPPSARRDGGVKRDIPGVR